MSSGKVYTDFVYSVSIVMQRQTLRNPWFESDAELVSNAADGGKKACDVLTFQIVSTEKKGWFSGILFKDNSQLNANYVRVVIIGVWLT